MWTSYVENPEAVTSTFGEEPSLSSVRLMKIELLEDGPTVNVNLALRDYPRNPPQRWSRVAANAVTLTLQLLGASQISIDGWGTDNVADCIIEDNGNDERQVIITGSEFRTQMICLGIRVARIEGYQRK
jgi:hypothetical protein